MISIESHDALNAERLRVRGKLIMDRMVAETLSANAKTIKEHQHWLRTSIEIERDIEKVNSRQWRP